MITRGNAWRRAAAPVVVLCLLLLGAAPQAGAATEFGPLPPPNPAIGPNGMATMHGDTASSDVTVNRGPGTGPVRVDHTALGAACPTILAGKDGFPQALCTRIVDQAPVAHLLDPRTGKSLAQHALPKGTLLGGVYAYLDDRDQLVLVDGNGDLVRLAHDRNGEDGQWRLYVASRTPLAGAVTAHCGGGDCDGVSSLMPDQRGRVWFASSGGVVGYADPRTGAVRTTTLPAGERVDNSLSTAPGGTAVASSRALYLLETGPDEQPRVSWRRPYDPGPARKPGQLSHGTGASPTFFGPRTGSEYVTITDNAAPTENLLVYDTRNARPVCSLPVTNGTEDSPVAVGDSVFVASTYGYPYPTTPAGAGPSDPPTAPMTGGMSRVDVRPGGTGCDVAWRNDVRSAAVPRLSTQDGLIHTISLHPRLRGGRTTPVDEFEATAVDAHTGEVRSRQPIGAGLPNDTLEMVGTITPDGALYQGTTTGFVRLRPR